MKSKMQKRFFHVSCYKLHVTYSRGFTLIESLIYIALLALIMGSFLQTAYQVIANENAMSEKVLLIEETNFLLKKIDSLFAGVTSVSVPALGSSGSTLSLRGSGISLTLSFDPAGKSIMLRRGASPENKLNSDFVSIDALSFEHESANGKEFVKVFLTIKGEVYELIKLIQ
ncbi:MAG: prepilin-type N-terminal cleavage/methylation domain-containing protein [Candidatus Taylorbacteria bacterium]